MSLYDTADLLLRCQRHARRPANDQAMPPTHWYALLTEAQPEVYADLFSRFPGLGFSAPTLMTTADGGLTYSFGTDANGDPLWPIGHVEIYPSIDAIPDDGLVAEEDFLMEGARIRMLNNRARTFSAGPYWRGVITPDVAITAAVEPQLQPRGARMLLVWKALEAWAARPGSGADPSYYAQRYLTARDTIFLEFATAYNRGGGDRQWYTGAEVQALGWIPR